MHLLPNSLNNRRILDVLDDPVNPLNGFYAVGFGEAAGGDGGRADPDAGGVHGGLLIERDHVLIQGDVGGVQGIFGLGAVHVLIAQVDEHGVVVRAAADDVVAFVDQGLGHRLGVLDHLLTVFLPLGGEGFAEGDGLGGDHVLQRAALHAGEYGAVQDAAHLERLTALLEYAAEGIVKIFTHHDDAAARTTEGLVGGGGNDVAVGQRIVEQAGGDEAGGVGDVGQQEGADFVGDLAEAGVVPVAAVGRSATDDHLWLYFAGFLGYLVHVNAAGGFFYAVEVSIEMFAAEVGRVAVAQVAAVGEAKAKGFISGFQAGKENGGVGLGTGVGLYVGVFCTEELAKPVDGELLHLVHYFTAAIVAFAGVAFGVFIGQAAAHRINYGLGSEVFRGDQLDAVALAVKFTFDEGENSSIAAHKKVILVALGQALVIKMRNYAL